MNLIGRTPEAGESLFTLQGTHRGRCFIDNLGNL
jgi:hypothetical protein